MEGYSKCYVAFLDILGFKNYINKACFDEVSEIFKNIAHGTNAKMALFRATFDKNDKYGQYNIALDNTTIKVMSDSIVVACDCKYPKALLAVVDMCWLIQHYLYDCSIPTYLRGGIAQGDYYQDNEVMFGKGMIDAYIAQEELSIYPRIILNEKIVNESSFFEDEFEGEHRRLILADDGFYYIDCLYQFLDCSEFKFFYSNAIKIKESIEQYLGGYTSKSVREKYLWLQKEYKRCTKEICEKYDYDISIFDL